MRRGTVLQSAILHWWAQEKGFQVKSENIHIEGQPSYLVGDLDGIVSKGGEDYVVEVKSSMYAEEPSDEWIAQVTWYEGLANISKAFIVIDTGREIREFAVSFDPELFALLKETAVEFYNKYVLPDVPPPPSTPSEQLERALTKFKGSIATMNAPDALVKVGEEWLALEARLKEEGKKIEAMKAKLADFMAEKGVLSVVAPTWAVSLVNRAGSVHWKEVAEALGAKERPELLEKYRGEPSRYIVIKALKQKEV
jgi:hypothetical protein